MTETGDVLHTIQFVTDTIGHRHAETMMTAWAREDPDTIARICVELVGMVVGGDEAVDGDDTPETVLKAAHAAYNNGNRSQAVVEHERQYQRQKKAKNRSYGERLKLRQQSAGEPTILTAVGD